MNIRAIAAALAIGVIASTGLAAYFIINAGPPASQRGSVTADRTVTQVQIGGPYELTSHTGETVTDVTFNGKVRLMFFGFIHCPDFCPTKLYDIAQVMNALGEDAAEHIQPIFVTVDPARDDVEAMAQYVDLFHPSIVGLTGTDEEIAEVAKSFRVYYRKAETDDPEYYNVDHSTFTYVMGPNNEFIDVLAYELTIDQMIEKLEPLVADVATRS